MPKARLTKRTVDAAEATGKEYVLWDEQLNGFGLKVTKQGAKSFIFRYRMGGRSTPERRVTIGSTKSGLTVEMARKEAEKHAISAKQGVDPQAAKAAAQDDAVTLAFNVKVEEFIENYLNVRWPKTAYEGARLLRKEVIPYFGRRPLPSITKREVTGLFDKLAPRKGIARNVSTVLRRFFNVAVERGELAVSPMDKIKLPEKTGIGNRYLDDVEISALWEACGKIDHPYTSLIRFLLLTGQRRDEVADMVWDEVELDEALWHLPGARTKNGKPHDVPLSAPAKAELASVTKLDDCDYVFTVTGKAAFKNWGYWKKKLDATFNEVMEKRGHLPPEKWTVHDLRRTVGTGMQRIGINGDVVEAFHNRQVREGVAGRYQHHNYPDEKRAAAVRWAEHVLSLHQAK